MSDFNAPPPPTCRRHSTVDLRLPPPGLSSPGTSSSSGIIRLLLLSRATIDGGIGGSLSARLHAPSVGPYEL